MTNDQGFVPIPQAIRTIFDRFPLLTQPPNDLPSRCPRPPSQPTLYLFSTAEDAARGKPSFNPNCLKWQTYLRLSGVQAALVPSSNHASPSGVLPFLVPAAQASSSPATIPINQLLRWIKNNGRTLDECDMEDPKVVAFSELVDTRVRDAWLYALYLEPQNFSSLASVLYRTTVVPLVNSLLARQYRASALVELRKSRPCGAVIAEDIYADAEAAFEALSTLLGNSRWFFDSKEPGLFDATVFGYTHLILSLDWHKKESWLPRMVRKRENLVNHERRLWSKCFHNKSGQ